MIEAIHLQKYLDLMAKYIPIKKGTRFGFLTALELQEGSHPSLFELRNWACRCDCQRDTIVNELELRMNKRIACGQRGCHIADLDLSATAPHIVRPSSIAEFHSWKFILSACTNPASRHYEFYGGKGIKMQEEWIKSFDAFYLDMKEKPTPKHRLSRKVAEKGFIKGNCYWGSISPTEEPLLITYNGIKLSCTEWSNYLAQYENLNLTPQLIRARYFVYGWDAERTLTTPSRNVRKK